MALYFKPPRGIIDYHTLQKCVDERLKFFKTSLLSSVSMYGIEYLYEDSALDRAGHFTLRLAALKYPGFLPIFINYEVELLKLRLNSYKGDDFIRGFFKTQLRHAKECLSEGRCSEKLAGFFNAVSSIFSKMLSRSYRSHVFSDIHTNSNKCSIFTLNVPFQLCTTLVARRKVNLKNGYARISCGKWLDLLLAIFYTFLKIAINEMHYSKNVQLALADERIKSIVASVCADDSIKVGRGNIVLSHIDNESKFFPLCMQNLQTVLKKKHRLAHEERFNLSLFLKDIGVSLDDSINYWKLEYSKECDEHAQCCHTWEKDEKRYIYSIRHMYGLEGSRKSYKSRSCSYFQNMILSPMQEGGCPFKHFNNENLLTLMSYHVNENKNVIDNILSWRKDNPSRACKLFLEVVLRKILLENSGSEFSSSESLDCDIKFYNSVQYFLLMKSNF